MQYIRKIFEGLSERQKWLKNNLIKKNKYTPESVSKTIFKYCEEYCEGDHYYDIDDIIRESYPYEEDPIQYSDALSYEEILKSITYLFGEWVESDEYIMDKQFNKFTEVYPAIEKVISLNTLSKEEIEDLFLDIEYRHTVSRHLRRHQNVSDFIIDIFEVKIQESSSIFNRVWKVISDRLPKDYYVRDIFLERHQFETKTLDFRVTISKIEVKE